MRIYLFFLFMTIWWVGKIESTTSQSDPAFTNLAKLDRIDEDKLEILTNTLETVQDLTQHITTFMDSEIAGTFFKILKQAPVLGVIAGFFAVLNPNTETGKMLTKIDGKLDLMEERMTGIYEEINDLGRNMTLLYSIKALDEQRRDLAATKRVFELYLKDPTDSYKKKEMERLYSDSKLIVYPLNKLFLEIKGEVNHGLTRSFPENLYISTKGDWTVIQKQYLLLQHLIFTSVTSFAIGCILSEEPRDKCEERGEDLISGEIEEFRSSFEVVLQKCKDNTVANAKALAEDILRNELEISNKEMAAKLGDQLRAKYFWRDFTVLVYDNKVKGGQNHAMWYNENTIHFFHKYKRNTVILTATPDTPDNTRFTFHKGQNWIYRTESSTALRDKLCKLVQDLVIRALQKVQDAKITAKECGFPIYCGLLVLKTIECTWWKCYEYGNAQENLGKNVNVFEVLSAQSLYKVYYQSCVIQYD